MNDSPESILSFEVVPQSVAVYTTASGDKMNKVVTEHVIALDSNGKLWVRLVDGFGVTTITQKEIRKVCEEVEDSHGS